MVAVKVHLANSRLVGKVLDKQRAKECLGMRAYCQKQKNGAVSIQRFPNGQAPASEGWEERETAEDFAAAEAERKALLADPSIPALPKGEWNCEGYAWYWREKAGLEWDGTTTARVFVVRSTHGVR